MNYHSSSYIFSHCFVFLCQIRTDCLQFYLSKNVSNKNWIGIACWNMSAYMFIHTEKERTLYYKDKQQWEIKQNSPCILGLKQSKREKKESLAKEQLAETHAYSLCPSWDIQFSSLTGKFKLILSFVIKTVHVVWLHMMYIQEDSKFFTVLWDSNIYYE